jgi:hypothetical protein
MRGPFSFRTDMSREEQEQPRMPPRSRKVLICRN